MLYPYFYIDLYVLGDIALICLGLSCGPGIYVSWSTSGLGVSLGCETGCGPPVKYFTDRSRAVLLLWILCVFFLSVFAVPFVRLFVCALWSPAGRGWPLGSRLWCLSVSLSLSHWCPGSSVVLDCIIF